MVPWVSTAGMWSVYTETDVQWFRERMRYKIITAFAPLQYNGMVRAGNVCRIFEHHHLGSPVGKIQSPSDSHLLPTWIWLLIEQDYNQDGLEEFQLDEIWVGAEISWDALLGVNEGMIRLWLAAFSCPPLGLTDTLRAHTCSLLLLFWSWVAGWGSFTLGRLIVWQDFLKQGHDELREL